MNEDNCHVKKLMFIIELSVEVSVIKCHKKLYNKYRNRGAGYATAIAT